MISDRSSRWAAWGPTVLRVVVGAIFLMYGWDKFFGLGRDVWTGIFAAQGIPLDDLTVVVVGLVKAVGGAALMLGAFTRAAAALLTVDMVVAILVVGLDGGF